MFLLLGGDYGIEPASLEAFPQQPYGCDGRANLLFALVQPFLVCCPQLTGGITLLIVAVSLVLISKCVWISYDVFQVLVSQHHL